MDPKENAFPIFNKVEYPNGDSETCIEYGLSKYEYFLAEAMKGLLSSPEKLTNEEISSKAIAQVEHIFDSMRKLDELKKKTS